MNPSLQSILHRAWTPPPPPFQPRKFFTPGAETHQFAALFALTVLGGEGTVCIVDVISAAVAGPGAGPGTVLAPGSAPDGGDTDTGAGDGGQGGPGLGGAPDTPDADSGGLGTAAVGIVYSASVNVVLQGAGTQLAVESFRFDVPAGQMGSSLAIVLADPQATVDEDDRIRVRIHKSGEHVRLCGGMRVTQLDRDTGYLSDRVSATCVNPMADRWARSPRVPLVLYDPAQTTLVSLSETVAHDIVDDARDVIEPEFRAVAGLDLHQLMNFVYVEKCQFSQVITNIPNYPLKRADFTLESTWHSVVASEIGAFEPVYGSDDEDILFVLDPQGTLPDNLPASIKKLKPRAYTDLKVSKQTGGMVNAVLLNYRDNTNTAGQFSGGETDIFESDPQEVGTPGTAGWQRTVVGRFIKQFHDNPADPSDVTRSIPWKTETRVTTSSGEISIETTTEIWTSDWRLRIGWEKVVQIKCGIPSDLAPAMREVQREVGRTEWAASRSNPGEYHKQWETCAVTGSVLETDNGDEPSDFISLFDAARSNRITADQSLLTGRAISTTTERFRTIGRDQIEMTPQKVNHLTGAREPGRTIQHTGTNAVRTSPQGRDSVTARMLITTGDVPDEEARPPLQFNAGNIPYDIARPLAQRLLDRRGAEPVTVSFALAGLDLTLRRGSLRRAFERDGTIHRIFVTGYSVDGTPGPGGMLVLSMSGQGVVIG